MNLYNKSDDSLLWQHNFEYPIGHFPVFLTLHGSGIPPRNHADAYKIRFDNLPNEGEFKFGVEGFWLVAPSR